MPKRFSPSHAEDAGFARFIRDAAKHEVLSREEEFALIARAQQGDIAAEHELFARNVRYLLQLTSRFQKSGKARSSTMGDLFDLAYLGFRKAVEKFDASKGVRLSTYANWWIRATLSREVVAEAQTIRVPARTVRHAAAVDAIVAVAPERVGPDELQTYVTRRSKLGRTEVRWLLSNRSRFAHIAIDATPTDDSVSPHELIADEKTEDPDERIDGTKLRDAVASMMKDPDILDARERRVLERRFGIDAVTLNVLAIELGVTRERVRQIESRALEKIRKRLHADRRFRRMSRRHP